MSTHRSFHNHTHNHYYYGNNQQQRGYNPRNAPRHPNYESLIRHHNVHDNPHTDDSFIVEHEYIAQQIRNQNQTHLFQLPLPYYHSVLPSVVVNNQGPYYPLRISGYMFNYVNFWTSLLIERDSRFEFRAPYNNNNHEEDDGDVLKYLKIRIHHAPAKDGVVADVESDICAICQSEYEHEESIGALQCGHEYHTDCIKQWLLTKKDCPMCRASVLPSQEQRSA